MKIQLLTFIAVLFLCSACSVNKLLSDANRSFDRKEYFKAAEQFRLANPKVKDKSQKPSLCYKLAVSFQQLGNYPMAAVWYRNAIRAGYKDSTVQLLYADALRGAGKPEEAKLIYEAQLNKDRTSKWASNGVEAIHCIEEWKKIQELYLIENLKGINSVTNDIPVQILPDQDQTISISSSREIIPDKKINPATGQKFSGFFTSAFDSVRQKWSLPVLLNEPKIFNSPDEELTLNFDPQSKMVVFCRMNQQAEGPAISKLYYSTKKDGQWSVPELIPFTGDGADYSTPMIANNGKTLWFASNRAGGKGGFDIWKSGIGEDGSFSEPENAGGDINTMGNEIYPYQKPNGYFYFSSDFHPGIGGFDIFQAQKINGVKWEIQQLPPPVNSSGDDLAIQFYGDREKGFFASNRKGCRGIDIFSFYLPPKLFQCFGKVHDSESDSILSGVNIRVVGSDGSSKQVQTVNGRFQVDLNPESDYAIVVFANGYLNAQAKVSTRGLHEAKEFEVDIKSVPTNRPIQIDNINYEVGKWDLLPQAKQSLEKLIELLQINPEAIIEIAAHTDSQGDDQFNLELSEKRAKAIVQYLSEKGIPEKQLKYKGYGESTPLIVTKKIAQKHSFLKVGQQLNAATIANLKNKSYQDIALGLNRRTEFKVLQAANNANSK